MESSVLNSGIKISKVETQLPEPAPSKQKEVEAFKEWPETGSTDPNNNAAPDAAKTSDQKPGSWGGTIYSAVTYPFSAATYGVTAAASGAVFGAQKVVHTVKRYTVSTSSEEKFEIGDDTTYLQLIGAKLDTADRTLILNPKDSEAIKGLTYSGEHTYEPVFNSDHKAGYITVRKGLPQITDESIKIDDEGKFLVYLAAKLNVADRTFHVHSDDVEKLNGLSTMSCKFKFEQFIDDTISKDTILVKKGLPPVLVDKGVAPTSN